MSKIEEAKTVKPRTVTIQLSDADCERIAVQAGQYGMTVEKILENMVADLIDGTYTNGSDERDFAEQWFNRCWFGMFPEDTLLRNLLIFDPEAECVEKFLNSIEEVKEAEECIKKTEARLKLLKEDPIENKEDIAYLEKEELPWQREDLEEWKSRYNDYIDEWVRQNERCHRTYNLEKEIDACRLWLANYEKLVGESEDEA